VTIPGFPRYKISGSWNVVRAGNLVRVKCSNSLLDEDFLVQEIKYTEPEGIAKLKLLSLDGCWEFSPFEIESIFSGLSHSVMNSMSRAGTIQSAPSTPSGWSASNITASTGNNPDGTSIIYFEIEVPRVDENISEYIVRYRVKNASEWRTIVVPQTESGNPVTQTPPVLGGQTYEFGVRSRGTSGLLSSWTSTVEKAAVADTSAPGAPSNLSATGSFKSIFLTWDNPSDSDLKYIEVWESDTNDRSAASRIAVVFTDFFSRGGLGNNVTKYYWIRGVDATGNEGAWHPTGSTAGVSATTLVIGSTDVDDFAITASKIHNKVPVLSGDSWTDNSPSAGSVAWNEHSLYYNGVEYTISAGSTSDKYIYWTGGTSYSTSNTNPSSATLGDDGFVIATNINGAHDLAWNAIANEIIGNAYIESITAEKITAGDIATARLSAHAADGVNAGTIAISADKLAVTGTTTFASGKTLAEEINNGVTTIDGGKITTGTIEANRLDVSTLDAITANMGTLTAGEIRLGTGTVGTDFAGIRIYNAGTEVSPDYRVSSWSAPGGTETLNVYLDSDGLTVIGEKVYFKNILGADRGKVFGASGEFLVVSAEDDLLLDADLIDIRGPDGAYFSISSSLTRFLKIYEYDGDAYITNVEDIGDSPSDLSSTDIVIYSGNDIKLSCEHYVSLNLSTDIDESVEPYSDFTSSALLLEDGDDVVVVTDDLLCVYKLLMGGDIQASDSEAEDIGDLNAFDNIFCDDLTTSTGSYDELDDIAIIKRITDRGDRMYDRETLPAEMKIDKEQYVEKNLAKYSKHVIEKHEHLQQKLEELTKALAVEMNASKRAKIQKSIDMIESKQKSLGANIDKVEEDLWKKAEEKYQKYVKIGPAVGLALGGLKQLALRVEELERRLDNGLGIT